MKLFVDVSTKGDCMNGKKLIRNASDVEYAWNVLEELGDKLNKLKLEKEHLRAELKQFQKLELEQHGYVKSTQDQIMSLLLFEDLIKINADNPNKIKEIIARFVNYVVWQPHNENGVGTFDVRLFNLPHIEGEQSFWDEALKDLGETHIEQNVEQKGLSSRSGVKWGRLLPSLRTALINFEVSVDTPFTKEYYTLSNSANIQFLAGTRPKHLGGGKMADQKQTRKYEAYQKRLEQSPLVLAMNYQNEMKTLGCKSIRQYARITGNDFSIVAKYLRILSLPKNIIKFLSSNQTPNVLRICSLRYLDKLTKISMASAKKQIETDLKLQLP